MNFAVCMVGVFFLLNILNSIAIGEVRLKELVDTIPVRAHISNINGTQTIFIKIRQDLMDGITNSGLVKDVLVSASFAFEYSSVIPGEEGSGLYRANAVNNIEAAASDTDDITFAQGREADFLSSDRAQCLMTETRMMVDGLSVGDIFTVYSWNYDFSGASQLEFMRMRPVEVEIVGSYRSIGSSAYDMIAPVKWYEKVCMESNQEFFYTSASFKVADPLNIEVFKDSMQKLGFVPVVQTAMFKRTGDALVVMDKNFVDAAANVRAGITISKGFFPFDFAIVLLAGFVASFLTMQGRKREFAIMRALGTGAIDCFAIWLTEAAAPALIGCLAGAVIAASTTMAAGTLQTVLVAACAFFSYLTGVAATGFILSRASAMEALTKS
jgi:hypothetical protein